MFTSVTAVVACSAMLFAGACFAQQPGTNHDTVDQIQVNAKPSYRLAPREFDDYAYTYDLSTGDSIRLHESAGRYFVNLNDGNEVQVVGQRPGVFLASTGTRFEFRDAGDTVIVTNPGALPGARPALAAMPVNTLRIVLR